MMKFSRYRRSAVTIMTTALLVMLFGCGGGGGGATSSPPPAATYTISGKVTNINNGAGVAGVIVSLKKQNSATVIASNNTDNSGFYTFTLVPDGTYTISSADPNFGFAELTVTVIGAQPVVADSIAFPLFSVTGKISLPNGSGLGGTTVTLYNALLTIQAVPGGLFGADITRGSNVSTATANTQGLYTFTGLTSGSYLLIPALSGYLFNPDGTTTVMTIATDGNVYVYDKEKTGNTVLGNIIYNSSFPIVNSTITRDFAASVPGGTQ